MPILLWICALSIFLGGCRHANDAYWGHLAKGVGEISRQGEKAH
jgi:hypothetical protein